jgi:DNA-binding helix-hairpin-helix protein with protein kinase domain
VGRPYHGKAIAAKRNRWKSKAISAALVALAIGILVLAANLMLLVVIAGGAAIAQFTRKPRGEQEFVKRYRDIQTQFMRTEKQWQTRSSTAEFDKLKASLTTLKTEFDGLAAAEQRRINAYYANRRAEHLSEFLSKFHIRHFKIRQIGPAKLAMLTSYGIETATDVTSASLQQVPGFGPVTSKPLLDWRKEREAHFVYNPNPASADQLKINVIKADIAKRRAEISAQLSTGPERLSRLAAMIRQQQLSVELVLQQLHARKTQAVADLSYLGLSIPNVVPLPRAPPAPLPGGAPRPYSPGGQTPVRQTPRCPHCGGRMVLRTARRGRGAGRKFYGCARYPGCRGTRSYP